MPGSLELVSRDPLPVAGAPGSGTARPPLGRAGDVALPGTSGAFLYLEVSTDAAAQITGTTVLEWALTPVVPSPGTYGLLAYRSAEWGFFWKADDSFYARVTDDGGTAHVYESPAAWVDTTAEVVRITVDPSDDSCLFEWRAVGASTWTTYTDSNGGAAYTIGSLTGVTRIGGNGYAFGFVGLLRSYTLSDGSGVVQHVDADAVTAGETEQGHTVTLAGVAYQLDEAATVGFGDQIASLTDTSGLQPGEGPFEVAVRGRFTDDGAMVAKAAGAATQGWRVARASGSAQLRISDGTNVATATGPALTATHMVTARRTSTQTIVHVDGVDGTPVAATSVGDLDAGDALTLFRTVGEATGPLQHHEWLAYVVGRTFTDDERADLLAWVDQSTRPTWLASGTAVAIDWSDTPTATVYDEADQVLDAGRRTDPLFPARR